MQGGKAPNAQQKRWQNWLAEQGCYVCRYPASIHHCVGSTGKHRKIHIGQDWVVPLCYEHHQGPGGIHNDLSAFAGLGETRKEVEKKIFRRLVARYRRTRGELPCSAEVLAAIEDWRR